MNPLQKLGGVFTKTVMPSTSTAVNTFSNLLTGQPKRTYYTFNKPPQDKAPDKTFYMGGSEKQIQKHIQNIEENGEMVRGGEDMHHQPTSFNSSQIRQGGNMHHEGGVVSVSESPHLASHYATDKGEMLKLDVYGKLNSHQVDPKHNYNSARQDFQKAKEQDADIMQGQKAFGTTENTTVAHLLTGSNRKDLHINVSKAPLQLDGSGQQISDRVKKERQD